jgi:hypothetical protein
MATAISRPHATRVLQAFVVSITFQQQSRVSEFGDGTMPTIRIPEAHWGKVWRALVASGPISRIDQEPIYLVSDQQLRLLRRKKLPFELVPMTDSNGAEPTHG